VRDQINPNTKRTAANPVKIPPATIPRLTTLLVPADFAIPLLPVDDDPPPLVLNTPPWTALGTTNPACAAADLNAATVSLDYP